MKVFSQTAICRVLLMNILAVLIAMTHPLATNADALQPGCVFWEGPDVRPSAKGALETISECPCFLTGIVKNVGPAPVYYVHVLATFWDDQTGKIVQSAWAKVGNGTLEPGQEEFVRMPLGLTSAEKTSYRRQVSLRWKEQEVAESVVKCIVDSTFTQYDENLSAHVYGFLKNVDREEGYAPELRARVLDAQGKTANILTAQVPHLPLEPGELLPFAFNIPAVSSTDSVHLTIEGNLG